MLINLISLTIVYFLRAVTRVLGFEFAHTKFSSTICTKIGKVKEPQNRKCYTLLEKVNIIKEFQNG